MPQWSYLWGDLWRLVSSTNFMWEKTSKYQTNAKNNCKVLSNSKQLQGNCRHATFCGNMSKHALTVRHRFFVVTDSQLPPISFISGSCRDGWYSNGFDVGMPQRFHWDDGVAVLPDLTIKKHEMSSNIIPASTKYGFSFIREFSKHYRMIKRSFIKPR